MKNVAIETNCGFCNKVIIKYPNQVKNSKSGYVFCDKSCSAKYNNKILRSGINNPNFKKGKNNYRTICWLYHKKECIICKEEKVVEAHHFDHNKRNNCPTNFVPLCSNHHKYLHNKKYKNLVEDKINEYHQQFIESFPLEHQEEYDTSEFN
jgi:FCS type zinc finger protein